MSKIYFVNWWVTYKCNFRCRYCYEHKLERTMDMNEEIANSVICFIKKNIPRDSEQMIVNFHGGEPLLQYNLIKHIVGRIKNEINVPVKFGITTNGSLISSDMFDFLEETFDYDISISIDGTKSTHVHNRKCISGSTTYEQIITNALELLKRIPSLRIRMTYDRETAPYLFEDIVYLYDLGFRNIVPVADFCSKKWKNEDFQTVKKQFLLAKNYFNQVGEVDSIYAFSDEFHALSPCTAGHNYYSIAPNGDIYPCTLLVGMEEFIIGNVETGVDIKKLSRIEEINKYPLEVCPDCELQLYCSSVRCKLVNYFTNGSYADPNLVQCNMMNIKYQVANEKAQD